MDFPAAEGSGRWATVAFATVGLVVALGAGSLAVAPASLAYEVTAEAVVVEARAGWLDMGREIPRDAILDAAAVRLSGGKRQWGSNRPGFCVGAYTYPELGRVWQATACKAAAVRLATKDGAVIVGPRDREGFLATLAAGRTGRFEAAAPERRWWEVALPLVLFAPALALVGVIARIARPFRYTIRDGVLHVPRHFGELRLPLAGVVVRAGEGGGRRVAGSSAPGFYLGAYRDARGPFHMCATAMYGVWVEGPRRVFISPADVEGFLVAAKAAGAVGG